MALGRELAKLLDEIELTVTSSGPCQRDRDACVAFIADMPSLL